MAKSLHVKIPQARFNPPDRVVKKGGNPDSYLKQTPVWQFHLCDLEHNFWGWGSLEQSTIAKLLHVNFRAFEQQTWGSIESAAGGRSHGTNSHMLPISEFSKSARDRLEELFPGGPPEYLFSLRICNKVRVYGVLENHLLKLVWYDPYHGSKDGAYPTAGSR